MSAFKIGQRVRVVRTYDEHCSQYEGREGVIASELRECSTVFWYRIRRWHGYHVVIDGLPNDRSFYPEAHQLEPILPEGWKPVEWADCLWQPEGIAA